MLVSYQRSKDSTLIVYLFIYVIIERFDIAFMKCLNAVVKVTLRIYSMSEVYFRLNVVFVCTTLDEKRANCGVLSFLGNAEVVGLHFAIGPCFCIRYSASQLFDNCREQHISAKIVPEMLEHLVVRWKVSGMQTTHSPLKFIADV